MSSEDQPILNVDCDGVLYDFTAAMATELSYQYGAPVGTVFPVMRTWALHETWTDYTYHEIHEAMFGGIYEGRLFRFGKLVDEYARDALIDIQSAGWHVRIVTAKTFHPSEGSEYYDAKLTRELNVRARRATLSWLNDMMIPYDSIAFVGTEGKKSYRADAIVDDKPDLSWTQWGALNMLYNQPWNESVELEPDMTLSRVPSWLAIRRELLWTAS